MKEKPTTAIALSLVSGILILVWGFWLTRMLLWRGVGGMSGVTGVEVGDRIGFSPAMALIWDISGLLIIIATVMLSRDPKKHRVYGSIILVFALISLYGTPIGIGSIIGAVGGILAITWKPNV
jgi:hypothetical protein